MTDIMGIDQFGETYHNLGKFPRTSLLKLLGYSSASKMYVDKKDGSTVHIGYIVGSRWITLYRVEPWEVKR